MHQRLNPVTVFLLIIPPLMWSGNAVVGRLVSPLVSPMTLNLMRWILAFFILLPAAGSVLRRSSPLWSQWRRFAVLGCWAPAVTTHSTTWPCTRRLPSMSRWWAPAHPFGCC